MIYERTQRAVLLVSFLLGAAAIIGGIARVAPATTATTLLNAAIIGALVLAAIVFSSMTIRVSADRIDWWLGFRLFHRVVNLAEVEDWTVQRVPLIMGLGIKTEDGKSWLVIVDGRTAIVLRFFGGRTLGLGTADPTGLTAALTAARERSRA